MRTRRTRGREGARARPHPAPGPRRSGPGRDERGRSAGTWRAACDPRRGGRARRLPSPRRRPDTAPSCQASGSSYQRACKPHLASAPSPPPPSPRAAARTSSSGGARGPPPPASLRQRRSLRGGVARWGGGTAAPPARDWLPSPAGAGGGRALRLRGCGAEAEAARLPRESPRSPGGPARARPRSPEPCARTPAAPRGPHSPKGAPGAEARAAPRPGSLRPPWGGRGAAGRERRARRPPRWLPERSPHCTCGRPGAGAQPAAAERALSAPPHAAQPSPRAAVPLPRGWRGWTARSPRCAAGLGTPGRGEERAAGSRGPSDLAAVGAKPPASNHLHTSSSGRFEETPVNRGFQKVGVTGWTVRLPLVQDCPLRAGHTPPPPHTSCVHSKHSLKLFPPQVQRVAPSFPLSQRQQPPHVSSTPHLALAPSGTPGPLTWMGAPGPRHPISSLAWFNPF